MREGRSQEAAPWKAEVLRACLLAFQTASLSGGIRRGHMV